MMQRYGRLRVMNIGTPKGGHVGPDVVEGDGVILVIKKEIEHIQDMLNKVNKDSVRLGEEEQDERIQVRDFSVCLRLALCSGVTLVCVCANKHACRRTTPCNDVGVMWMQKECMFKLTMILLTGHRATNARRCTQWRHATAP